MQGYRGAILKCNENNEIAKYLVEHKGKIVYIGNTLEDKYKDINIIDLKDKAIMPSFVDTHIHFASFALFNSGLNVFEAKSNKELLQMIKDYIKKNKQKIVISFGASPHIVKEQTLITKDELDTVTGLVPTMVVKYDGHALIANSALIDMLTDDIKKIKGYNEQTGIMENEAFFAVTDFITNSLSTIQLVKNMIEAVDFVAGRGISMVHTVSGVGFPNDLDVDLERWFGRGIKRGFQSRIFFQTMDINKVIKRKLTRVGGCFETALDGCFGSVDAALLKPYENSNSYGYLYNDDETVIDFCMKANRAKLQIELHAIGDKAFNQATKAIEAALQDYPRKDHRHCIIHACMPTEEGLKICAENDILVTMQTSFINWEQEPQSYLEEILGDRANKLNPVATINNHGIKISLSSDAPCTTPDPMLWIHNAVNNPIIEERVQLKDALRMATYWGYYTSFDENERGTLETGKIADMVVLNQNPFDVDADKLKDIKVKELILGGKKYKKQPKGVLPLILRGVFSNRKI